MKVAIFMFVISICCYGCGQNSKHSAIGNDSAVKAGENLGEGIPDSAKGGRTNSPGAKTFSKTLSVGKIVFHVFSPNNRLHNSIIIQPSGIIDSSMVQTGVAGDVVDAMAADINGDGYPEIYYVVFTEAKELNLFGYGSEQNKRLTPVYMPDIGEDKKFGKGHRNNDEYTIDGTRLKRSFPIYNEKDPMSSPSGGKRMVSYRLIPGKNGWILKPVDAKEVH